MAYLRTKSDLINLAEAKLPQGYVSIARAFHTGTVENLGAFRHIAGGCGWILKITSKFKSVYYVAIVVCYLNYRITILNEPPWKYWEGDKSDNKMYQGDNPILYKELKDAETKRLNKDEGHTCPDS